MNGPNSSIIFRYKFIYVIIVVKIKLSAIITLYTWLTGNEIISWKVLWWVNKKALKNNSATGKVFRLEKQNILPFNLKFDSIRK